MPLPLALSPAGRVGLLTPSGELDVAVAAELRTALREAVASDVAVVVLDLRDVDFLDSTVLGVVVEAHRSLAGERRLRVVGARGLALRTLQLTGLDGVLDTTSPEPELERELARLRQG